MTENNEDNGKVNNSNYKISIYLTILTAILAFSGALGGSLLSGYFNSNLWQDKIAYEQTKEIIKLRVELIQKVSTLANKAPILEVYQSYLKLQAQLAAEYIECNNKNLQGCIEPENPKSIMEISNKKAILNADFASTLQLVSLYFGPGTKAAIAKLAKEQPWWKIGEQNFRDLLISMHNELNYKVTPNN